MRGTPWDAARTHFEMEDLERPPTKGCGHDVDRKVAPQAGTPADGQAVGHTATSNCSADQRVSNGGGYGLRYFFVPRLSPLRMHPHP